MKIHSLIISLILAVSVCSLSMPSPCAAAEEVISQDADEPAAEAGEDESQPEDIAQAAVICVSKKVYTGKAIKPQPVIEFEGKTLIRDEDYTVSYANNKKVGKARVMITGTGLYTGTVTKTFRILPRKTALRKLRTVWNDIRLSWKKRTEQTSGYQIQYSRSRSFEPARKTVMIKSRKKGARTIRRLKSRTRYYVRIRTFKTVGGRRYCSSWSAVKSIVTGEASRIQSKVYNNRKGCVGRKMNHLTRKKLLNWLAAHGGDRDRASAKNRKYYLGTRYMINDHRNPAGDKNHRYGALDVRGRAAMNCTGFVWHALYRASGRAQGIPAAKGWCSYIRNQAEYKSYYNTGKAASNKEMVRYVLEDGYLSPGDIVWFWDGAVAFAWDQTQGYSPASSPDHHVGIYVGDYFGGSRNCMWHSIDYGGVSGNVMTRLMPRSSRVWGVTVIKISK